MAASSAETINVVYVTAIFPYIILLVLIIRGVTLDGSLTGLKFLFVPDWSKLLQLCLWQDSAEQVFFSLGISWGILNMFGSYNRFDHKVYIDAYLIVCADLGTSLLGCRGHLFRSWSYGKNVADED